MSEPFISTQSTPTTTESHTTIEPSFLPFSTTESLPVEPTATFSQTVVVVTQTQIDASTFSTSTSTWNTSPSPTSSSTYDGASATSTPFAQAQSTGLSAGTSAGIGVGVAIGVLLLALAVFLIYRYNRKRRTFAQEDSRRREAYPELPELAIDGQKYELEAEDNENPAELAGDRPKNGQTETDTHELE